MKKIIFIDVDGTLTTQKGSVPESAKSAIKKTQKEGNLVYLCTGRSMAEITPELINMKFDGIIAAGGGYIEIGSEVLKHETLDEKDVIRIMDYFDTHKVGYYLESNDGLFPNSYCINNIRKSVDILMKTKPEQFLDQSNPEPQWFIDILNKNKGKKIPKNKINKISFVSISHPYKDIHEEFKDDFYVYPSTVFEFGGESGEIGIKGIDKKTAIKMLLSNIEGEYRTYAFGDGINDIAMFKAVDYSVAMNNAHSKLKLIANEITDIAENNGIHKSFIANGLI